MRVIIVAFQKLNKAQASSSGAHFGYLLAKRLYELDALKYMIFSHKKNNQEKYIKKVSIFFRPIEFILGIIKKIFNLNNYLYRYILEILYDMFLSIRLLFVKFDILITLNPWIPLTCKFLKIRKKKIILIAGNQNDNLYKEIVQKEKSKLGITSYDPFDYPARNRRYNKCLKNIGIIICLNKLIAKSFQTDQNFKNKTFFIFEYFFPPDYKSFQIAKYNNNNRFTVGYLAHTTVLKGLHVLLEAWSRANLSDAELIIGGNIEPGYFNSLKSQFNATKNFKLLGNIYGETKNQFFNKISVFVCPSLMDAGPVTVIEALYYHKPVLISDGVGHNFLIKNGYNGFIYKYDDTEELANKLLFLYQNHNKLKKMSKNASNTIQEKSFQENNILSKIVEVLY